MKRTLVVLIAFACLLAIGIASLPFLISPDFITQEITAEIEELTGRKVSMAAPPEMTLFPVPRIKVSNLSILNENGDEKEVPLLAIEILEADLDLFPAIFGQIGVTEYRLTRPRLNLVNSNEGKPNWLLEAGLLRKAYTTTYNKLRNASSPDEFMSPVTLGDFVIIDGAIKYKNIDSETIIAVTAIDGTVEWPNTSADAEVAGSMIWKGESIQGDLKVEHPMELIAGGESSFQTNVSSEPASIKFNGSASMVSDFFLAGTVEVDSPSIMRLAETLSIDPGIFGQTGRTSLSGEITATAYTIRLTDAKLDVSGNKANGLLSLERNESGENKLDGTLAFQSIDLSTLLAEPVEAAENVIASSLLKKLMLDLRISANSVQAGLVKMANLAATVKMDSQGWSFDIGDSSVFGGNVVAQFGVEEANTSNSAFLSFAANEIDIVEITHVFPQASIGINGKSSITANLKGKTFLDLLKVQGLDGTLKMDVSDGAITGINLPALLVGEGVSPSTQAGETVFDTGNFNFFLNDGVASISQSQINTAETGFQIIGDIDLDKGNLALRAQEITEDGPGPERIFIGGTLKFPLVTLKNSYSAPARDVPVRKAIYSLE